MSFIEPSETWVQEIQGLIEDIQGKIDGLQAKVNSVLDDIPFWVPGFIVDRVHDAWNGFCDKLNDLLQKLWDMLDTVGEPATIRQWGDGWTDSVGAKVSAQAAKPDQMRTDDTWQGIAANAYADTLPAQKAAMQSVKKDFTDALSEQLDKMANGIVSFVTAMRRSIITFTGAIATAIIGISGIVSAPPAILAAVVAAGVALADYMLAKDTLTNVAQEVESGLRRKAGENGAMVDGAWPKAVGV